MGSILEGSGLAFGDGGAEPLPAGSQKKATPKELLFLYLVIRPMSIFKALGLSVFCNLIYFFYSIINNKHICLELKYLIYNIKTKKVDILKSSTFKI